MFEELKNNSKNTFYKVTQSEIEEVEKDLGFCLPDELKEFYLNIGYGFIHSSVGNINRIMDPYSVRDFRLRQNDFEYYPDIEIYDDFEEGKLIFFEANEVSMLSIAIDNNKSRAIFYYNEEIATNFLEFINKIIIDDTFYYNAI
ncbi:SMI1/KNR4 family protein [Neisseria sp. Ec49-e6-T10]|uniref:SMI1/KNR4 family protein n=1 Tax=Neisseria sp. Ec49-e6-T10 TaxID=3140744 RepID=UPI003EBDB1AB